MRGAAAIEMAKSDSDLALAADEFRMATELAPEWAFAWMNLGQVQARLGQLRDSMASYKRYLSLAPNDKDAARISDEVIKLEFRMEQAARIRNRAGIWVGEGGAPYLAKADGNSLILRTTRQNMSEWELTSNEFLGGDVGVPQRDYRLEIQGRKVSGTSSRSEIRAGKCTIPAETVEVEGTYDEATGRIDLKVPRTRFQSRTSVNLFLDPVDCAGVNILGKETVDVVFLGPVPDGGIGVGVNLAFVPGGILIRRGWHGHLGVCQYPAPDEHALSVGLQERDEILAIDGVEVKAMGPVEAVRRLRGKPGSEVSLTVMHRKSKEPVTLHIPRVRVSSPDVDKPFYGNYDAWPN
ncbi:MAG TPA: PDZ domain-containing protein [Geothrix sp.]